MNPGRLTSPVQGKALERAIELRASGWQWDAIGAELSKGGQRISGSMVGAVVRRTKPTVRFDAQAQRLSKERVVADPPLHETPSLRPRDGVVGDVSGVAVHTSKSRAEAYLLISDLQIPYHHPGALGFCKRVRFEFGVPLENMICVGDEFDMYWMSRFEKAISAPHTANKEVEAGRIEIARWIAAFPHMMICDSNHVKGRMVAAASRAGLASAFIRDVREVYNIPPTWRWADHWIVKGSKHPFRVEHGNVGPGGHSGLRGRPLNRMISTAWGHEHSEPGVVHVDTHGGGKIWGMRTGSLLTTEPVAALSYNAEQGSRPVGSVGVVLDGGRTPLVVRM